MPIYEYRAKKQSQSCSVCRVGFEQLQTVSEPALKKCPECGGAVQRVISPPTVGASKSGFDDRAKSAGFSKLRKVSKGEYEKEY